MSSEKNDEHCMFRPPGNSRLIIVLLVMGVDNDGERLQVCFEYMELLP